MMSSVSWTLMPPLFQWNQAFFEAQSLWDCNASDLYIYCMFIPTCGLAGGKKRECKVKSSGSLKNYLSVNLTHL